MLYLAKAPGSLMIMGEYAVLHGKTALVCAIDQFLTVKIHPRDDDTIIIDSELGHYEGDRLNRVLSSPFEYVLAAINLINPSTGCYIEITSEFSPHLGLGSSAAVITATLAALHVWQKIPFTHEHLWHEAKKILEEVQGSGSGADLAASIYGGIIAFKNSPFQVTRLPHPFPLCAVYSGKKIKTSQAIDRMQQRETSHPSFFTHLYESSEILAQSAIRSIQQKDWKTLGTLFDLNHGLLVTLGVSTDILETLRYKMKQQPEILGAKISGSGWGDCLIGIGTLTPEDDMQDLTLSISDNGLNAHEQN